MAATPEPGDKLDINSILQAAVAGSGSTSQSQQPLVPLWVKRAKSDTSSRVGFQNKPDSEGDTYATGPDADPLMTSDQANAAWIDLTDADKAQFVKLAQEAGVDITNASQAADAWSNAVKGAENYNASKGGDSSKYLSPFEFMDKLGGFSKASQSGGTYDGFKQNITRTYKSFTEDQVANSATDVFRQELGRGPTAEEIKAMTLALNKQAMDHPDITTNTSVSGGGASTNPFLADQGSGAPDPSQNTVVNSGGFDPSQSLLEMARQSPDHAVFQAASTYYNAAMQALSAIA